MEIIFLLTGFIIGIGGTLIFSYLWFKSKYQEKYQKKILDLTDKFAREETQKKLYEEKIKSLKVDFEKSRELLKIEFKNLANNILEENSQKFTKLNQEKLDILLNPLNEKIKEFKEKVEKTYYDSSNDRSTLKEQIRNLSKLNNTLSQEANDLTNALKGQSKIMGDWGEIILEKILEKSGLIKGEDYLVQQSLKSTDNKISRPDIIINLPQDKHLIIDSKVSIISYEKYSNSTSKEEREVFLKEHIDSIKKHIKSLTEKKYQYLEKLYSPDFVFMFIPIDSALFIVLQNNYEIFTEAFNKNIYIVSPLFLIFAIRTISNIWKTEKQNKNALEIAKQSGLLYDKFVNFYENIVSLGDSLNKSLSLYDDILNRLKTGKGNLIKRVERIKKLGARTTKNLPEDIIEDN